MKTALGHLSLCLLVLSASGFPFERKGSTPPGAKEKRVQYAARDDVNIIAHGLLQLGQNLKEHVDKTKVQMRDIFNKLKAFNRSMSDMGKDSLRLQARALEMEDREGQLLNVTVELRDKAEEVQQERRTMSERMSRIEEKVDSMLQGDKGPDIQLVLEAQSRRMEELAERVRLQQDKLDKQSTRLRTLQGQIQRSRPRPEAHAQNSAEEQRDSPVEMAADCHQLFLRGETTSGVYTIQPLHSEHFNVFCEMTADGGWTVIQRRQDGSVDFDQPWEAYENGFGSLNGEFWLGLDHIHTIAKNGSYVLEIKFSDWGDDSASVRFPFKLGGKESNYSLRIPDSGTFSTLESSLGTDAVLGLPFSTSDHDNDHKVDMNCAKHLSGGWWFTNCGRSNLNGRYFQSPPPKQRHQRKQGIFWKTWRGRYYPLKSSTMMIAPADIHKL
nr:angiopoietin-related protein 4 [Nothobranchius furzeri]